MGMSTYIVGFRSASDPTFQKMKAAYEACEAANVEIPAAVSAYFVWSAPDEAGVEVSLKDIAKRWTVESKDGYEIQIDKIPKDITTIRFYNSF